MRLRLQFDFHPPGAALVELLVRVDGAKQRFLAAVERARIRRATEKGGARLLPVGVCLIALVPQIALAVSRTMASVGSSSFGSLTVSSRMSPIPWKTIAFIGNSWLQGK